MGGCLTGSGKITTHKHNDYIIKQSITFHAGEQGRVKEADDGVGKFCHVKFATLVLRADVQNTPFVLFNSRMWLRDFPTAPFRDDARRYRCIVRTVK